MTEKKVKKESKKAVNDNLFKLELDVNGTTIKGEGETFAQAIEAVKPPFIKSRGYVRLNYGGLNSSKLLNVVEMRRLFSPSKMTKQVLQMRLYKLLK
jgi:hypothetical protein